MASNLMPMYGTFEGFPEEKKSFASVGDHQKTFFKLVLIRFVKSKFTSRILHQNARPSSWEGSFSCHFCPDIRSHGSIDPPVETIYHSIYTQRSSFKSPNVLLKFDRQKYTENLPIWYGDYFNVNHLLGNFSPTIMANPKSNSIPHQIRKNTRDARVVSKSKKKKNRCIAAIKTIPGGMVKLIYCDVWDKIFFGGLVLSAVRQHHRNENSQSL